MRIFILIITLVLSAAFCLFNLIGFRGVLTPTEFYLVNIIVDIVLAFILGHFMYRTYANYRKGKKLQQTLNQVQADLDAYKEAALHEKDAVASPAPAQKQSVVHQQAPTQEPPVVHQQAPAQEPPVVHQQAPAQEPPVVHHQAPAQEPPIVHQQASAQEPPVVHQQAPVSAPPTSVADTQPMPPVHDSASTGSTAQMGDTALYQTPFSK